MNVISIFDFANRTIQTNNFNICADVSFMLLMRRWSVYAVSYKVLLEVFAVFLERKLMILLVLFHVINVIWSFGQFAHIII